jgi:hypothetical protein
MLSMKLLLAFGLLTGIFVDECNLGDFNIDEFADRITVTNLSSDADAFVGVKTNHGQVNMDILAGKSRTATAFASTTYTVKVVGHVNGDSDLDFYKDHLLTLRSQLQDLSMSSTASPNVVAAAAYEVTLVQDALAQMYGSQSVQSCSGKLVYGKTSQVTVKWNATTDDVGFWVLDCG